MFVVSLKPICYLPSWSHCHFVASETVYFLFFVVGTFFAYSLVFLKRNVFEFDLVEHPTQVKG